MRGLEILGKPVINDGLATVCAGSWLGCDFFVKVFNSEEVKWNKDHILRKVGALIELRHPHVVRLNGFAQGPESCVVLMEMMSERDLRHYLHGSSHA